MIVFALGVLVGILLTLTAFVAALFLGQRALAIRLTDHDKDRTATAIDVRKLRLDLDHLARTSVRRWNPLAKGGRR